METPQTINFSRKCRDKVNTHFANLRKMLTPVFPDSVDWNRFKIIERALVVLGSRKNEDFETEVITGQKTNKEACALYRSKLNRSFEDLKETLRVRNLVNLREYRLFTRAGILDCAISSIDVIIKNQRAYTGIIAEPTVLPRPVISSNGSRKRSCHDFYQPESKFSRTPDSTGSISPKSDDSSISPVHFTGSIFDQSALARIRTLAFLKMISETPTQILDEEVNKNGIWRPW